MPHYENSYSVRAKFCGPYFNITEEHANYVQFVTTSKPRMTLANKGKLGHLIDIPQNETARQWFMPKD